MANDIRTDTEIKANARSFFSKWNARGDEKQDTLKYWCDIFTDILGIYKPTDHIQSEKRVIVDGNTKFIDVYIPETRVIIEQKSLSKPLDKKITQSGGDELTPYEQAKRYNDNLPVSEKAKWVVTCNFAEIWVYNMDSTKPEETVVKINIVDLQTKYPELDFLVNPQTRIISQEMEISKKAGEEIGKIYDAILTQYHDCKNPSDETLKSLNMLCVRLVFCFYAEDAGIFGKRNLFTDFIRQTEAKNLRKGLIELFKVFDQKENERDPYLEDDLKIFPYVNGGLFTETDSTIPQFTESIKQLLLESGSFTWEKISPTIFGAIFESTLNQETRRHGGMHYTSIQNIHKVIDPLFMNSLNAEFAEIKAISNAKNKRQALYDFQNKLGNLTFFDPACGSGNFLTESFMSLRRLENECIKEFYDGEATLSFDEFVHVKITQFYGIEINDFAVAVAKTALWIAESIMLKETSSILSHELDFLPLTTYANIVEGNALRLDWKTLRHCEPYRHCERSEAIYKEGESLPLAPAGEPSSATPSPRGSAPKTPEECHTDLFAPNGAHFDYIMGNPPFVGARLMSENQKKQVEDLFGEIKDVQDLDYVCCWYKKAAQLIQNTKTKCALVSTNSISQGAQVPILWKVLFNDYNVQIDFAYRTFRWDSESNEKAHVHCVIVGFSCNIDCHADKSARNDNTPVIATSSPVIASEAKQFIKFIYDGENKIEAKNISPYLFEGNNIYIEASKEPLWNVPKMIFGNQPRDGGHFVLTEEEKDILLKKEPELEKWIKLFIGAEEFINNKKRYCLWLKHATPNEIIKSKILSEKVKSVREFRLNSKAKTTNGYAKVPHCFAQMTQPDNEDYLIVPRVSSEKREYLPIGFMKSDIISSDAVQIIPNATLSLFGILTSSVHMAWMRVVCGRLKSDYRYSKEIIYNNFPFPSLTDTQKAKITQTAQAILDARAKYPDCSLADLYGENMYLFPELVKAHTANDNAVKEAYGFAKGITESEIVAELFKLYEEKVKLLDI